MRVKTGSAKKKAQEEALAADQYMSGWKGADANSIGSGSADLRKTAMEIEMGKVADPYATKTSTKAAEEPDAWQQEGSAANESANILQGMGLDPSMYEYLIDPETGEINYDNLRYIQATEAAAGYDSEAEREAAQGAYDRALGKQLTDQRARMSKAGWGGGAAGAAFERDAQSRAAFELQQALANIARNEFAADQAGVALSSDILSDLDRKAADEEYMNLIAKMQGLEPDMEYDTVPGQSYEETGMLGASAESQQKTKQSGTGQYTSDLWTKEEAEADASNNWRSSYTYDGKTMKIKAKDKKKNTSSAVGAKGSEAI